MSYRLEYQYALFVDESAAKPRYVVAVEGGDNNLYEHSGRRVRDWDVSMLGCEATVLKRAVYYAGSCEGGSVKPFGRDCRPETYVARIRRLLANGNSMSLRGYWFPDVRLPQGHPAVDHARSLGLVLRTEVSYGRPVEVVDIPSERRNLVFDFADLFTQLPSWLLAKVGGLPAS